MALRRIAQIGEAVLRKKSRKVEKIDDRILQLLDDMAETMYGAEYGGGLAAPQVGIHETDHLDGVLYVDKIEK